MTPPADTFRDASPEDRPDAAAPARGPRPGADDAASTEAAAYRTMFDMHDRQSARRSAWAGEIADRVVACRRPRSVVDVGCGLGFLLAAFEARGIPEATGVDAAWVEGLATAVPRDRYLIHDLATPLSLPRRYDLAACLEVAEHLDRRRGPGLVDDLAALSDWVLFSAAIPGQGGRGHVNCRWQSYWAREFAARGYACYDPLRRALAAVDGMAPWFAQNLLLYVREGAEVPATLAPFRIAPAAADMVVPRMHRRILARTRRKLAEARGEGDGEGDGATARTADGAADGPADGRGPA